ncbi:MAG: hypothetical protein KAY24_01850 [Candidatus Eisenbacteria sp.]|nr:hypothetical protein [Candidatus Eisenbacteria bacterium]
MARRAAFIDSLQAEQTPLLLLEGGSFFSRIVSDARFENITSWLEMERLGYAAVTLGEREFIEWTLAESLLTSRDLPVVCSNVERLVGDDWVPVGSRYQIAEVNGVRFGIMSVITGDHITDRVIDSAGGRIRVLPPMETTREVAALLRQKADVVVLLGYLNSPLLEEYAATFEDVDVIVGGHMTRNKKKPYLVGSTIVNLSGTRGQHIGVTQLTITPKNELVKIDGENVTFTKDYPENPAVAKIAQNAKDETRRLRKERNLRRRQAAQAERAKRKGAATRLKQD